MPLYVGKVLPPFSVEAQVAKYLSSGMLAGAGLISPAHVHLIVAGSKDFIFTARQLSSGLINQTQAGMEMVGIAKCLLSSAGALLKGGAHHVVLATPIDPSVTPLAQSLGPVVVAGFRALYGVLDMALRKGLEQILAANPLLNKPGLPQLTLFEANNIVAFGFNATNGVFPNITNYVVPCCFNPTTKGCDKPADVCKDPAAHYFWDGRHPTAQVHAEIGAALAQQVLLRSNPAQRMPLPPIAKGATSFTSWVTTIKPCSLLPFVKY